jgi:hypothetical protein
MAQICADRDFGAGSAGQDDWWIRKRAPPRPPVGLPVFEKLAANPHVVNDFARSAAAAHVADKDGEASIAGALLRLHMKARQRRTPPTEVPEARLRHGDRQTSEPEAAVASGGDPHRRPGDGSSASVEPGAGEPVPTPGVDGEPPTADATAAHPMHHHGRKTGPSAQDAPSGGPELGSTSTYKLVTAGRRVWQEAPANRPLGRKMPRIMQYTRCTVVDKVGDRQRGEETPATVRTSSVGSEAGTHSAEDESIPLTGALSKASAARPSTAGVVARYSASSSLSQDEYFVEPSRTLRALTAARQSGIRARPPARTKHSAPSFAQDDYLAFSTSRPSAKPAGRRRLLRWPRFRSPAGSRR